MFVPSADTRWHRMNTCAAPEENLAAASYKCAKVVPVTFSEPCQIDLVAGMPPPNFVVSRGLLRFRHVGSDRIHQRRGQAVIRLQSELSETRPDASQLRWIDTGLDH
jgi:hypothetical protein